MTSILERMLELQVDDTLTRRSMKVLGSLGFRDVSDNLSGEEVATILATLQVLGTDLAQKKVVSIDITESADGKVHHAQINDGVRLADSIGG